MKKLLSLLWGLLLLSLLSAPALAEEAVHPSTRAFLAELTRAGIPFVNEGLDEDGSECVAIPHTAEPFEYTLYCLFDEGQENASLRAWYLIAYDPARTDEVILTLHRLNQEHRWLLLYADESDCTVTASMDLIFRGDDAGRVALEGVRRLSAALHEAWPVLSALSAEGVPARPAATPAPTPAPTCAPGGIKRVEDPTPAPTRAPAARVTPAPAPTKQPETPGRIIIVSDSAILRGAPSTSGAYVATARAGDSFTCLGEVRGWYIVDYNGRRAYVSTDRAAGQ